jgi:putative transposase
MPGQIYHVTTCTFGRARVFSDVAPARAACMVIAAPGTMGDAQLLAWVLMPDHLHLLLQLGQVTSLRSAIGRVKTRSAWAVRRATAHEGAVWASGFHDRALRREDDVAAVAHYIIANPLRAELVSRVAAYPYWDAVFLDR